MPLDLTDKVFDRLTALRATKERDKDGSVIWECVCECGERVYASSHRLTSKRKKSCGCLTKDLQRKRVQEMGRKNFVEGTDIGDITNKKVYSTNTSGVRGVYWYKRDQKWTARITFQGKTYFLGSYENLEDAKKVRKEAEDRIFGDFLKWYNSIETTKE